MELALDENSLLQERLAERDAKLEELQSAKEDLEFSILELEEQVQPLRRN